MRWRLLLLLVIALSGCTRYSGPLETRRMRRPDALAPDGRRYTIEEQQIRERERMAITEDDFRIGPKGYIDRPSPIGR